MSSGIDGKECVQPMPGPVIMVRARPQGRTVVLRQFRRSLLGR